MRIIERLTFLSLLVLCPLWTAEARPSRRNLAQTKVSQAVVAYRDHHYQEAAELFLEAYQVSGVPNQLRNAARAYQEGGLEEQAEQTWVRYRDHHGLEASERAEAQAQVDLIRERRNAKAAAVDAERARQVAEEERIAKEEAQARAAQVAAAAAPVPVETPSPPPAIQGEVAAAESRPTLIYVGIGVGAAALLGGGALLLESQFALGGLDDRLAQLDNAGKIVGTTPAEAQADLDGLNERRVIGAITLGIGTVLLSGALGWLLSEP